MKSELAEKLFSICGSADLYATYGYNDIKSITQLTEEQRIEIESLLIDNFYYDLLFSVIFDMFYVDLTERYHDKKEKC